MENDSRTLPFLTAKLTGYHNFISFKTTSLPQIVVQSTVKAMTM